MPLWLPILVGLGVLIGHNQSFYPWTLDDAFITFRYAENFANGNGPVYNPGERVEGYTTFLWMAILAISHSLGANTVIAAKTIGGVLTCLTLAMVTFSYRFIPGITPRVGAAAGLLLGTSAIVSRWALSGMEVPLVTCLTTITVLLHLQDKRDIQHTALIGFLAALTMMSRPDAGLVFGVLFLDRVWRKDWKHLICLTSVFLCVFGAYFAWRLSYYGWLLPNTFYVKVGSTTAQIQRGLTYLLQFFTPGWFLMLCAMLSLRLIKKLPTRMGVITLLIGLHTAYVVLVGGDVFWGYRFFAAHIPLLSLLAAATLVTFSNRWFWGLVSIGVTMNLYWLVSSDQLNADGLVSNRGIDVGFWLKKHAPEDALLATNIAGSIPYYSELTTIDTLGLNDVHIAHREIDNMGQGHAGHEKGDGDYVLSRAPDYVIFASSLGDQHPKFLGDRELFENPEFHNAYDIHIYPIKSYRDLTVWVRRTDHGGKGIDIPPRRRISGSISN